MPTYEFLHQVDECKHEWEEYLSIVAPDPEECPKCKVKGNILRLISGGSGKGMVELTGHELIDKVKSDTQKLKKDITKSDKLYSNLIGESKYHELQTKLDRRRK